MVLLRRVSGTSSCWKGRSVSSPQTSRFRIRIAVWRAESITTWTRPTLRQYNPATLLAESDTETAVAAVAEQSPRLEVPVLPTMENLPVEDWSGLVWSQLVLGRLDTNRWRAQRLGSANERGPFRNDTDEGANTAAWDLSWSHVVASSTIATIPAILASTMRRCSDGGRQSPRDTDRPSCRNEGTWPQQLGDREQQKHRTSLCLRRRTEYVPRCTSW